MTKDRQMSGHGVKRKEKQTDARKSESTWLVKEKQNDARNANLRKDRMMPRKISLRGFVKERKNDARKNESTEVSEGKKV